VLLFSHGGGGVVGSIASYDTICRQIATRGQVVVLSVDYRLCPEHPYPAAQEDMEAAYHFLIHTLAPQYPQTICMNKFAVMGDSFGGHLAASFLVRLHRKKEEDPQTKIDAYYHHWPKACILIYPAVDLTAADHNDSFTKYGHVSHLTPASVNACAQAYLRSEEGGNSKDGSDDDNSGDSRVREELRTHPEVSVLFAKNLQAFWPTHTLILSAECDPLLDEAIAFKHKLDIETTNKNITQIVYPKVIHGFFSGYDFFPETELAFQEVGRWLKECGIGVLINR
jgi:acetyl esterase